MKTAPADSSDAPIVRLRFGISTMLFLPFILASSLEAQQDASREAEAAVGRLIEASRIYDKREMFAASHALAKIGKPAVPSLMKAMNDVDDNVRWQAIVALGRIGSPGANASIRKLVKALGDIDPDVRGSAAESLGILRAKIPLVIPALRKTVNDEHGLVRASANWSLWELESYSKATPALVILLSHKDWMVVDTAVRHLGAVGKPAVAALTSELMKKDSKGRTGSARALGLIGPEAAEAIPGLIALLSDTDAGSAGAAAVALGNMGKAAVGPLIEYVNDESTKGREGALSALGSIGDERAVSVLVRSLKISNHSTQLAAIKALGDIGTESRTVVSELLKLLKSTDKDLRGAAASALGRIGSPARLALAELQRLTMEDAVDFVRSAAADAMTKINVTRKAVELFKSGQKEKAVELVNDTLKQTPRSVRLLMLRAQMHEQLQKFEQAIADSSKAIDLKPSQAELYELRGSVHFKNGDIAESIADFDRFLKAYPEREPHHWQRGISYYYAGEFAKGVRQFEIHKTVNPDDVENAAWHFLCKARLEGVEKARASLIPIMNDARIPMMTMQKMFAGKATAEEVIKKAREDDPPPKRLRGQLFYAHLYIGLYSEALGKDSLARRHIELAATKYFVPHYMGEVARVHLGILKESEAKTKDKLGGRK